jgi:hypothetical protein
MSKTRTKIVGPNRSTDWMHEVWTLGVTGWALARSFLPMGSAVAYAEQVDNQGRSDR